MPNILTVINLFAGVLAVLMTFVQQWAVAVALVFGAAVFDSLDGRVARRLNVTSEFGKQLDALADLVSFGVAPAIIVYQLDFFASGWGGYVLVALFPVCGALRLARFNISNVRSHYAGLPITVAGPVLAAGAYLGQSMPMVVHAALLVTLSGLMISTIKVRKL
jgi:CDP-diacylglycerol--serine O-phosphatidyltransferase